MHAPLEFSPFTSRLVGVYKNPASSGLAESIIKNCHDCDG